MVPAYYFLLFSFFHSLLLGLIIMPNVLAISHKHQLYDIPNTRKIHHTPIPRLGGTTFLPVIIITVALMMGTRYFLGYDIINLPGRVVLIEFLFLLCASCMIYTVGIVDDLIGVSWKWKLLIQIICGLLLAISGLWIHNGCGFFGIFQIRAYIGIPLTIFFVVYMINAINLIDGVDGLASCLSGVSLIVLTHIFIQERQLIYALMSFSALGIIVPFACYNIFGSQEKKHKLFMGDTGTLSLGLILSFLTLRVLQTGATSTYSIENKLEILSSLIIPLFDTVRVTILRISQGKNPFLPDKNHFHHQLLRLGLNAWQVTMIITLLSIMYIVLNKWLIINININVLLCINICIFIFINTLINKLIKRKRRVQVI